ncbi:MAG TPA: hypothetical protein VMM38_08965 [Aridibacter sp.]|nr:hypothetical protein [Aridibacter sp.]
MGTTRNDTASREIDEKIENLGDWRGETLAWVRKLIPTLSKR